MRARWFVMIALAGVALAAPRASAQSTAVRAQNLVNAGRVLLKAGNFAEACTNFEASQKLEPTLPTLLFLAGCRESNRQLATAWALFGDATRLARTAGNARLARVAKLRAQKLAPLRSKLTITVADRTIPGLQITRDNAPVDAAAWGDAQPIDGGTYTITAQAPGRVTFTTSTTINAERDAQTVAVPALAVVPPVVAQLAPPSAAPRVVEQPARARRSRVAPLVLGGGALALGAVAIGFELSGRGKYDDAKKITDNQARRDTLEDQANTRHRTAQVLGVAAVGCAGVAVYLYIRSRGEARTPATAVAPIATPQLAGLAVVGHW